MRLYSSRYEIYKKIQEVFDYLYESQEKEQDEIHIDLLTLFNLLEPSPKFISACRIAKEICCQIPNTNPSPQDEYENFWLIVLLAALPYLPGLRKGEDSLDETILQILGRIWEKMLKGFVESPSESQEETFLKEIMRKIASSNPGSFTSRSQLYAFLDNLAPNVSEFTQFKVGNYNEINQTQFRSLEDIVRDKAKKEFEKFAEELLKKKSEPNFLVDSHEQIYRHAYDHTFKECLIDAIIKDKTIHDSKVLELLDHFICDFISPKQKTPWFHSAQHNFGYHRPENEWKALLVEEPQSGESAVSGPSLQNQAAVGSADTKAPFLQHIIAAVLDNLEESLDLFKGRSDKPFPFFR